MVDKSVEATMALIGKFTDQGGMEEYKWSLHQHMTPWAINVQCIDISENYEKMG